MHDMQAYDPTHAVWALRLHVCILLVHAMHKIFAHRSDECQCTVYLTMVSALLSSFKYNIWSQMNKVNVFIE